MNLNQVPYEINDCCGVKKTYRIQGPESDLVITEHDGVYEAVQLCGGFVVSGTVERAMSREQAEAVCAAFLRIVAAKA